jgi:NSS family neurotransmitter:Na+ symporter
MEESANNWSSKIGFILAAAGSAIGLGNIWRLPYLVAQNGGGTFLVIYLFFCFSIGLSILLAEFTIGRYMGKSLTTTLPSSVKFPNFFSRGSYIFLLVAFTLLSFYFVVAGWTLTYTFKSALNLIQYDMNGKNYYEGIFSDILSSPWQLIIPTILFVLITAMINYKGVIEGVEKVNLYMLPALFIMLIIMIVKVLTLDGAMGGVKYIFSFKPSFINKSMILSALGQAFFSLSVGMGIMIIFGSYVKSNYNLKQSAISTVLLGSVIGIFSSLMIIPAVFAFHLDINAGPSLTFMTLPTIFAQLPLGAFFATIFFLMMSFAALTSTISILETAIPFASHILKSSRKTSVVISSLILSILSVIQALSFNKLSFITLFGMNTFDLAGNFVNLGMMVSSIFLCILIGFCLPQYIIKNEITNHNTIIFKLFNLWYLSIKYIIPIIILLIMFY